MSNAAASSPPPPMVTEDTETPRARPLDAADLAAARQAIADEGLVGAARRLNIPRTTLAGAASGACLREGTRMVVSDRLRRPKAGG